MVLFLALSGLRAGLPPTTFVIDLFQSLTFIMSDSWHMCWLRACLFTLLKVKSSTMCMPYGVQYHLAMLIHSNTTSTQNCVSMQCCWFLLPGFLAAQSMVLCTTLCVPSTWLLWIMPEGCSQQCLYWILFQVIEFCSVIITSQAGLTHQDPSSCTS